MHRYKELMIAWAGEAGGSRYICLCTCIHLYLSIYLSIYLSGAAGRSTPPASKAGACVAHAFAHPHASTGVCVCVCMCTHCVHICMARPSWREMSLCALVAPYCGHHDVHICMQRPGATKLKSRARCLCGALPGGDPRAL